MLLNVKKIINAPGARQDFSFEMDLSDVELGGRYPFTRPVVVTGDVRNIAGMLILHFTASTVLSSECDRCLKPFDDPRTISFESMLAEEIQDEESEDDIIVLENDCVDLLDLARTMCILEMDTRTLCSEDCKGLCPRCGADLNQGSCHCKRDVDPRLAALAKLLEKED